MKKAQTIFASATTVAVVLCITFYVTATARINSAYFLSSSSQFPNETELQLHSNDTLVVTETKLNKLKEEFDQLKIILDGKGSTTTPPLWKENSLLNITNFTWKGNHEEICKRKGDYSFLNLRIIPVLIHSARTHFEERQVIRETWGSASIYNKWSIRIVFMLGQGAPEKSEEEIEKKLEEEQASHGDLVIGSFHDSYRNLSLKHLMGYKWALNYCREAPIILKFDDDVYVDIFTWLDWLDEDLTAANFTNFDNNTSVSGLAKLSPQIYCKLWAKSKPYREKSNKFYTSYEEWPEEYWPPFCSGWAYSIPLPLVEKIYSVSNQVRFNWMDDLFLTGQLLQKVRNDTGEETRVGDISAQFILESNVYEEGCANFKEDEDIDSLPEDLLKREIIVAKVERGKNFRKNVECLWKRSLNAGIVKNKELVKQVVL